MGKEAGGASGQGLGGNEARGCQPGRTGLKKHPWKDMFAPGPPKKKRKKSFERALCPCRGGKKCERGGPAAGRFLGTNRTGAQQNRRV